MRRFAGDASIYFGASIISAAIPFLLLPILTRVLTPVDYGMAAMFGVVSNILGALTGLSVHGAITVRYFKLDSQHLSRYIGACFRILTLSTLVIFIVVALIGTQLTSITLLPTGWLLACVLMSAAQVVINMRLSLWQVQNRAIRFGVFQGVQAALNVSLALVLVIGLALSWQGRALGQLLTAMILMGFSLFLMRGEIAFPLGGDDTRDALKFGIPLIPHVLGGLLIAATDRMMIANMLDVREAGIYTVALQIGMAMSLITESFNKVYAPRLLAVLGNIDVGRDRRIVRHTYLYFVAVVLAAGILGVLAPPILSILAGREFQSASGAVFYIALGYAFGGMYYMVTIYVFFASRTASLAVVTLCSGIFNVAVTWYLIKLNGVVGAAQSFALSQAVLFVACWCLGHRARPMPWRQALFRARNSASVGPQ